MTAHSNTPCLTHRDHKPAVTYTELHELAKCDVLCRSCHEEHHAYGRRRHGSRNRYRSGCRCDPCRAAKARENAKYLARRALRAPNHSATAPLAGSLT